MRRRKHRFIVESLALQAASNGSNGRVLAPKGGSKKTSAKQSKGKGKAKGAAAKSAGSKSKASKKSTAKPKKAVTNKKKANTKTSKQSVKKVVKKPRLTSASSKENMNSAFQSLESSRGINKCVRLVYSSHRACQQS